MPTLNELRKIYHHELQTILYESELLLQKEGGLNGELRTSGSIAEQFVKRIFSKVICPDYIKITGGYIANPSCLSSNQNLSQCDLLFYDAGFLPIVSLKESGINVLPQEAILGVVEVKRTLTKEILCAAVRHIQTICSQTDLLIHKKDLNTDKFNRHVGRHNNSSFAPVLGVVALQSNMTANEIVDVLAELEFSPDFVLSFDGTGIVPAFVCEGRAPLFYATATRPEAERWGAHVPGDKFVNTGSSLIDIYGDFFTRYGAVPDWARFDPGAEETKIDNFSKISAVISLMFSRACPRPFNEDSVNAYYFP